MNEMLRLCRTIQLTAATLGDLIKQAGGQSLDENATHAIKGFTIAWGLNRQLTGIADEIEKTLLDIEEQENVGSNR